ncbi:MAG TPA: hypothetical protein PKD90_00875 [Phnomibacter sp.]|nr:hypothetical protein [Phnomibacter sp.]
MATQASISTDLALPLAQDFFALRQKGLEYIQQLSHALWTDHNLHDPGITILEVLCYALTDLGYRTGFDIKDLITEQDGSPAADAFHSARQIFHNNPVSIADYRRLLIDVDGIRNAWLFTEQPNGKPFAEGVPLHAWCSQSKLLHAAKVEETITNLEERAHVKQQEEVQIKGLYAVKLLTDEHPLLGDLQSQVVNVKFAAGALAGYELELVFPYWQLPDTTGKSLLPLYTAPKPQKVEMVLINDTSLSAADFKKLSRKQFGLVCKIEQGGESYLLQPVKAKLIKAPASAKGLMLASNVEKAFSGLEAIMAFMRFAQRPAALLKIFGEAREVLMANRNLCEDFLFDISLIDSEDLALCMDLDVQPQTDLEQIQADIFAAVENYLLPPVHFSALQDLLEKGVAVEDIFEGPPLKHGFLTDDALQQADLKPVFYISDIVSLIMDVPGVVNIRTCMFSVLDTQGNPIPQSFDWKIMVSAQHRLRLNRGVCKFTYYKNNLPLQANFEESVHKLRLGNVLAGHLKYNQPALDLPVPAGKYRNLDNYETILNEFPNVYGLGIKPLPETATIERKAQAKQLQAYLTFFDQLLANYMAQLGHVKRLLSWNSQVSYTYLSNYFYNEEHVAVHELFGNVHATMDANTLQEITQTLQQSWEHRNRILDHLLSRFAESFADYATYMYALPDELVLTDDEVSKKLITDKQQLLQKYPALSAGRGTAFNYTQPIAEGMQNSNLSGYALRMLGLLGMPAIQQTPLHQLLPEHMGGFYLVEHLLLRPVNTDSALMSVCLNEDCNHCGEEDPYSFKVSIVLPYWLKRFTNMAFRNYMETLFRQEAPAHVLLKICWVDQQEMQQFETAYAKWTDALLQYAKAKPLVQPLQLIQYNTALSGMVEALEKLRTDFPTATLHDCQDRNELNDTRVFLGGTVLGTFMPTHEDGIKINNDNE